MHRSIKQLLLQKSSHQLLQNNVHESTYMFSAELSDELHVASEHNRGQSQHFLHKNKR